MKRLFAAFAALLISAALFAVSYTNNTYQKLADEYTKKAEAAFDAGQYDDAVDYSAKAAENAALSKAYIDMMLARSNAESEMKIALNRINWAESISADKTSRWLLTSKRNSASRHR